jgi:hypothetical protein
VLAAVIGEQAAQEREGADRVSGQRVRHREWVNGMHCLEQGATSKGHTNNLREIWRQYCRNSDHIASRERNRALIK